MSLRAEEGAEGNGECDEEGGESEFEDIGTSETVVVCSEGFIEPAVL